MAKWIDYAVNDFLKKVAELEDWKVDNVEYAKTTESAYIFVTSPTQYAFKVRVSSHLKPGFSRMTFQGFHVNITSKFGGEKAVRYMVDCENKRQGEHKNGMYLLRG